MTPTTPNEPSSSTHEVSAEEARRIIAEYHLYANDARRRILGRILDRPDALADALRSLAAQLEAERTKAEDATQGYRIMDAAYLNAARQLEAAQEQLREAQEMAWEACGERDAAQDVIEAGKRYRREVIGEMDESLGSDVRIEDAPDYPGSLLAVWDAALARYDAARGESPFREPEMEEIQKGLNPFRRSAARGEP